LGEDVCTPFKYSALSTDSLDFGGGGGGAGFFFRGVVEYVDILEALLCLR